MEFGVLSGLHATSVKPYTDLIEGLRKQGIHSDVHLPQIAVLDAQLAPQRVELVRLGAERLVLELELLRQARHLRLQRRRRVVRAHRVLVDR